MGFAYASAPASTQGTVFASMDPPTYKSPKVQWVQTLLASEWICECPKDGYQEGKLSYHEGEGVHGTP